MPVAGGRSNHAQGADSRDGNALAVPAAAVEEEVAEAALNGW